MTTIAALGVLLALLATVTVYAARPLGNYDTWFHLRLGEEFWHGWSLRHPGALSTFATSAWVPTQWSTEMVAAKAAAIWGVPGVALLFGVLALGFVVALYAACRREAASLPAVFATVLGTLGATGAISARPQLVSLVLIAVTLSAWLQTARDLRIRWWLIPLTWVWATAHGLWSFGVVLGAVCAAGIVLDRWNELDRRSKGRLLGLPVLCGVAACLTPIGPRLVLSQLIVADRTPFIGEWGPTSFHAGPALVVAAMVAGVLLVWARRGGVAWVHLLLLLLAGAATVWSVRLVPIGAIVAAPLLASALSGYVTSERDDARQRWEIPAVAAGLVACTVGLAVAVPHTASRPSGVPTAFTARLAVLPEGTTVYNQDTVGGWLEWRFPRLNPVLDGMFDAYPVHYIEKWRNAEQLAPGWRGFVTSTGARVAVLKTRSPLANAMQVDLGWRRVQTAGRWVYLVAPAT